MFRSLDAGNTVEMHGNIRQLVCPDCRTVTALDEALLKSLKAKTPVPCTSCPCPTVRCRIMLYDDAQGAWSLGFRV